MNHEHEDILKTLLASTPDDNAAWIEKLKQVRDLLREERDLAREVVLMALRDLEHAERLNQVPVYRIELIVALKRYVKEYPGRQRMP